MATTRTISEIQSIVSRLAAEYGVQRVYLFGSYARGGMSVSSDIDLRVDKGTAHGLHLASLLLNLEDALGVQVDLIPSGSLDQRFLAAIQADEILLYEAPGL